MKPSPLKEKIREQFDLPHIDKRPPLLPSDGRYTQSQS
jgi:hypothetical protein